MSVSDTYRKKLDDAAKEALRKSLHEHPDTSVAELRGLLADHPALGRLTLAELIGDSRPVLTRVRVARLFDSLKATDEAAGVRKPSAERRAKPKTHDVRTEAGRAELDHAVLEAIATLGGVDVAAEAIRARVGGTAAQIRTSLNRQIGEGKLTFTGRARATRYSVTD